MANYYSYANITTFCKKNQLHAVSRTQQGKQREPSVKTLRSPLSAEFWRQCVLSGRNQCRILPRHLNENIQYLI